ncbi:MAG: bifunctional phosphopantothenoylcysteine decarboxylase/phosphopantothenate--cysteine ligase CoaBC [Acidimicrobiia bacterium]|nr:bifunctional phosphopantothenoylcysteine decarboxylase/phosphopantothenate--cysteine ligase CoaBC [Acidimicrobiia bacterium]MDH5289432.1 bifunctional phosphopantothenoylcysteine decarboxylase/phosphopantothenate--cysteine ligase CoaBC [Acidimicrobiia bacterium]
MLHGRRIVLGVTGGIAAYKAIEVCRRLVDLGAHVTPVLTEAALNMVGPTTFTALASEPVKTSLWRDSHHIPHTRMGQTADAILVCPATARIISDLRTGRSADLLSATLLATNAPVVICPAMHTEMWEHPATQENLDVLVRRGVIIVPPEEGRLAGGDIGKGRLADPATVVQAMVDLFATGPLSGRSVLVTAGGTREPIDPVRYIGNRSSGKQGHAIAEVALAQGAKVTLVTTVELATSPAIDRVQVETAAEMSDAVLARALSQDIVIMAAAVADFRPLAVADEKIKKTEGVPEVRLERTDDILAALGQAKRPGQVLVGFAAETSNVRAYATDKLARKGADLIVANDVSAPGVGFAHDTNAVTIIGVDGSVVEVALSDKSDVARAVLNAAALRLPDNESQTS